MVHCIFGDVMHRSKVLGMLEFGALCEDIGNAAKLVLLYCASTHRHSTGFRK
jgi:hypothetical protein